MNKRDLIDTITADADLDRATVETCIDAAIAAITTALANEDKVALAGFGTFEVRHRNARTGRNPATGETIEIAASKAPAFKPATALKNTVNS